jgi:hypothetical protein
MTSRQTGRMALFGNTASGSDGGLEPLDELLFPFRVVERQRKPAFGSCDLGGRAGTLVEQCEHLVVESVDPPTQIDQLCLCLGWARLFAGLFRVGHRSTSL